MCRGTEVQRRFPRGEAGIALTSVVIVAFIMMLLVGSTITYAVNSQDVARRDQDWNAALAAADAGIDDYIYRLNRFDAYWRYPDQGPPPDGNQAFSQWVPVPGPANDGRFRYRVDTSTFDVDGTIKIASTGLVRDTTRTVYATLRRQSFLDYLYFTDYEVGDPSLFGPPFVPCARHYWATPGRPGGNVCADIYFFTRDIIRGPLHTNDSLLIAGNPQFLGPTTSSWENPPGGRRWRDGTGSSNPFFARAGDPAFQSLLPIPPSNVTIRNEADPVLGGTGCLYSGPTQITLKTGGKMDVESPLTAPNPSCVGFNLDLPPNGVIYVERASGSCPTHPLGYGFSGSRAPQDRTAYGNCDGDAFVSGTLNGRLTVATENNIIVVDDLLYEGGPTGDDLLGLVANNFVEVYHPVRCPSSCSDIPPTFDDAEINAAILAVNHSFIVQNYAEGTPKGRLTVFGAIAQRFRGPVGTFSGNSTVSGYEKDYVYDDRLQFQSPPYFLDPVRSSWKVATWAEIPPCYPDDTGPVRAEAPCDRNEAS
jgi:hypothetical protein